MHLPKRLEHIQKWFGGIITQDLDSDIDNAADYITSTETLQADERMRLYNHSYWLRLFDALHEEYPFLSRLFGKESFNAEIAIPFLHKHPPDHWSLNLLGRKLPQFLEGFYHEADRSLVLKAAHVDWACQQSFFAIKHPEINLADFMGNDAEKLLSLPLQLQSHVHFIEAKGQIMLYREAFLKQEHDYWLEHDFPEVDQTQHFHFIIFRNHRYTVEWDILEPDEHTLLMLINSGVTIEDAIEKIPESDNIPLWIQKWLLRQWISLKVPGTP